MVVLGASLSAAEASAQEDWQSAYQLGDAVELKITDSIWQKCTVSENPPGGIMRVSCEEYVEAPPSTYSRAGGTYIVYGKSDLRWPGSDSAPPSSEARSPSTSSPSPVAGTPLASDSLTAQNASKPGGAPNAAGSGLRVGQYACYGSGSQILAGLGFEVLAGGRYADLDGVSSGSYSVNGTTVTFRGGHLDGTVGRDLAGGNFRVGAQATCEPW